jgi:hypothetical protein
LRASSTAVDETETARRPISVSVRTRLATLKTWLMRALSTGPTVRQAWASAKASFTCPRIWLSPTTSESRLAATRNAWRMASSSMAATRCGSMAVSAMPRCAPSARKAAARASPGTSATPYTSTRLQVERIISSAATPRAARPASTSRSLSSSRASDSRSSTGALRWLIPATKSVEVMRRAAPGGARSRTG